MRKSLIFCAGLMIVIASHARDPIEEQRVRHECIVRAELFAAIVQAHNTGETLDATRAHMKLATSNVVLMAPGHPLVTKRADAFVELVLTKTFNRPRNPSEIDPIALQQSFQDVCLANPDEYTKPAIIDWARSSRDGGGK